MAFKPVEPSKSPIDNGQGIASFRSGTKLTVNDQDFPGSLLFGQSIEDEIDGFTKDGTVGGDFFRGAKILVLEGTWLDVVQDITSHVGLPPALLEVLQGRLDGNDIMGVAATLNIRKSLSGNDIVSGIYSYVPETLTGPMMRLATTAAGPS